MLLTLRSREHSIRKMKRLTKVIEGDLIIELLMLKLFTIAIVAGKT